MGLLINSNDHSQSLSKEKKREYDIEMNNLFCYEFSFIDTNLRSIL